MLILSAVSSAPRAGLHNVLRPEGTPSGLFYFRPVVRYAGGVFFALAMELKLHGAPAGGEAGREGGPAVLQMQPGEAEDCRLPGLAEAGEVQPLLAGVAHHVAQVEPERLVEISFRRLVQAVLRGEERVRGEAQR